MQDALLLLLFAGMGLIGPAETARNRPFFEPINPPRRVQAMAHRGASRQAPENSAPAIEFCIADSIEWVEVDVRRTRDGVHVLIHDDDLSKTTDGIGSVRDQTLDDLRKLDSGFKFARRFTGQRILTLDEGLKLAKNRINLYLDCKNVDVRALVQSVRASSMENQVVVYGDEPLIRAVASESEKSVPVMTKWQPKTHPDPARWAATMQPDAVEIDADAVTLDAVSVFRGLGIEVEAKTLGDRDDRPEVWDRVIASGVDWIQTDRPEEITARTILKAIGPRKSRKSQALVSHHRFASRYAPENTLAALEKSIRLEADFVEFDVRTTRDGGFVLLHDGTLNRTTNGRGPVREAAMAELSSLDAGSWFGRSFAGEKPPQLDSFLSAVSRRSELYYDAKDITPEALAATLRSRGLAERTVVYKSVDYLEKLRAIAPEIRRMPPLSKAEDVDSIADRVRPYAFDTRWSIVNKNLIEKCHEKGVKVFSDALGFFDTVETHERAIRDGIDLIQTDHPLRFLRALERVERRP
jgi:glycerophosphoryl diester phosphodiesterase